MKKYLRFAFVFVAVASVSGSLASTRYGSLMTTQGGRDSLNSLALWEDQRVTGDGALFEYLSSTNPIFRIRTVEVIGRIQDPADITHLVPMLADPDPRVVDETIFAMGQLGADEAFAPLMEFAKSAPAGAFPLIAEAMGKIGSPEAVDFLLELLRNFNSSTRSAAALALARTEDETAGNSLLISIQDPDPEVTWRSIYALEKIKLDRVGAQVLRFLEHEDPFVRAYAARTLGKHEYRAAAKPLADLLEDSDRRVVVNAARALGEIGDKNSAHPLGKLATQSESHQIRRVAVIALGKIGDKNGKDYLVQRLMDRSSGVRGEAIKALANILGSNVVVFAEPMLDDGTRHVRADALTSLGDGEAKGSLKTLMRYATHSDPMLRTAAIGALGSIDDDKVGPFLVTRLADDDWVVVTTAVSSIGKRDYRDAVPSLIETYRTRTTRQDVDIRLEILRTLEAMKVDASSLAHEALEDNDLRVRELATRILTQLDITPDTPTDREFYEVIFDRSRYRTLSPPLGTRHAVITTPHGDIQIELFGDDASQTVARFIHLVETGFYDGLTFHRVVPNFVVQGGDPRGDGWGDAGYYIRSEFNRHRYGEGFLGIAHAGKDSGGCQFFITYSPQRHLDGRYTIFGRVTKGLERIWQIDQGEEFSVHMAD